MNGSRGHLSHELSFVVNPTALHPWRAATDEHRTQRRKCNQFVGIHGQIVRGERARVLQKIPCHPVIFAGGGQIFTVSPKLRRRIFAPPAPDDPISAIAKRWS